MLKSMASLLICRQHIQIAGITQNIDKKSVMYKIQ